MVSVIVPMLNEELLIRGFLDDVWPRVGRCGGELILVDGSSDDRTAELADGCAGARRVNSERGRGRQMNRGAAEARGTLLVFLPVDTRLAAGAFRRLARIDEDGVPAAGGFHQRFDSSRRFLRLVSTLHNLRARLTGVAYGDQVPFVRRDLFRDLGGFREDMDMEDVEFGARLRRRTRPRIESLIATTSSRRFDEAGDLRATIEAARLLAAWTLRRKTRGSRIFFDSVR